MDRWGPRDVRASGNVLGDLIRETRGYGCAQKREKEHYEEYSLALD
jgi:hypothetical protein